MKLAVLGSPVEHSLSPVMHNAALAAAGVCGEYVAIDVDENALRAVVDSMREGQLHGANVTMPHKAFAHDLCDTLSPWAERIGAVNTLTMLDPNLIGDNTDVVGIRTAWKWANLPMSGAVTVFGSGGAAAAAVVALADRDLSVVARRPAEAEAMVARSGINATVWGLGSRVPSGVLVNATPIGMKGEPLPVELIDSASGLFEMAYGNEPTPAVQTMRSRGRPVAEGLDMLIGQAVASFNIWTGISVDPDVMRAAALGELARRRVVKP